MSSSPTNVYQGVSNPPRRAKSDARKSLHAFILPKAVDSSPEPEQEPPRSRKSGPMSRTAREAQRKLNHSAIEKARRTKINGALARLKELVPPDFGRDPLDEQVSVQKGEEREFKLDILVKTVSFMEHLLDRVSALESQSQTSSSSLKRKATEEPDAPESSASKTRKLDASESQTSLPSFSTLLDNMIDPCLLNPTSPRNKAYLPSPPASGQFDTVKSFHLSPPELSLEGPAVNVSRASGSRNADDESAASLLLHIKTSSANTLAPLTPSTMLGIRKK